MAVVGCMLSYNNIATVKYSIQSLMPSILDSNLSIIDRLVVVDGRWSSWGYGDGVESTDGTVEYLESIDIIPVKVIKPRGREWRDQVEKRNAYLIHGELKEDDWLFIIDADEYIVYSRHPSSVWFDLHNLDESGEFESDINHPVYNVNIVTVEHEGKHFAGVYPRLIKYVEGMNYFRHHAWLRNSFGVRLTYTQYTDRLRYYNGFSLINAHILEDKERCIYRHRYYEEYYHKRKSFDYSYEDMLLDKSILEIGEAR